MRERESVWPRRNDVNYVGYEEVGKAAHASEENKDAPKVGILQTRLQGRVFGLKVLLNRVVPLMY